MTRVAETVPPTGQLVGDIDDVIFAVADRHGPTP